MSVTVILELRAPRGGVDKLLSYMEGIFPETRAYQGFEDIRVLRDVADPQAVVCLERWASAADYQRYLGWRMETGVMTRLAALLEGSPRPVLLTAVTE